MCTYQTPPVGSFAVANPLDDLRGEILRSAAVRVSAGALLVRLQTLLREAEVSDLDVAFVVQQDILRLQVSVDDSVCMETPQSLD